MGTIATIEVVAARDDAAQADEAINRAFNWFREVERTCNRFDSTSELRHVGVQAGMASPVSPLLFGALEFALGVAADTGGAFDPTLGASMEARGFRTDYRTGQDASSGVANDARVSYRDVHLDAAAQTISVDRPLVFDLGAVAKGLAIDLAARELRGFTGFAIDAGGDIYAGGRNATQLPWSIGIRHPHRDDDLVDVIRVSNAAVCTTSGSERPAPDGVGHHVFDPRRRSPSTIAASASVVASTAMVADAFATAAFVLGPVEGIAFLERHHVDGVIFSPGMDRFATAAFGRDDAAVFPDA